MTDEISAADAKAMARRLRTALTERGHDPGHSGALELVARALGARDWNTFAARASGARTGAGDDDQRVVPLLRMIDWTATRRFYVDFLGSTVDWVDDAGDHTPRYVAITLPSGARLQLSEHHGDGTPGAALLVTVDDLDRQLADLNSTEYGAPPAIEESRMGRSITVYDPAGNRIVFVSTPTPGHRYPDEVPPIVTEVLLPLRPAAAFERFTSFSWWHHYGLADDGHVSIDDGEVVFHNPDGAFSIGRVLVWEPAARYAQTFTLAQDADHPTTLTAIFEAVPDGTRVRVEHGGWNAGNASRRSHFADWPLILSHLAD
ncbi:MAG: SRPBCC domain-containing protein [Microlunatus sp.]|nr:SRPBCC domain-containing protein [Microlunatus sp.]